ncbi:MAG: hydroxyacylglutathione hydrolase [Granulosicoccus sp.]
MKALEFHQFSYASDNYAVLIHEPVSGETACVDAGDAAAVMAALKTTGWQLSQLFITHHHADHVAGLAAVKKATSCKVFGPMSKAIVGIDVAVADGDLIDFAGHSVRVIQTPGHTLDMINYYFTDDRTVFTGDTLFSMGCGRLFEGDAKMMWQSLGKLMALPADSQMYCAHEYTETNAGFALTVDPNNEALLARTRHVKALRAAGKPTVPVMLSEELVTNPFLRAGDAGIRRQLAMPDASDVEVFAELRERRNRY